MRQPIFLLCAISVLVTAALAKPRSPRNLEERFFLAPEVRDVRLSPGNGCISYIRAERSRDVLEVLDLETGLTRRFEARRAQATPFRPSSPFDSSALDGSKLDVYNYHWVDRETIIGYAHHLGIPRYCFVTDRSLSRNLPMDRLHLAYDLLPDIENLLIAKEEGRHGEKFFDLYQLNTSTQSMKTVTKNPGHIISWITDKDGVIRIRHWIDENEQDRYDYRAGEEDEWRTLPLQGDSYGILFIDDPESFIFFHRPADGSDKVIAQRYNAADEEFYGPVWEDPEYDLIPSEYVVDPETEASLGFRYQGEFGETTVWLDPRLAEAQAVVDAAFAERPNRSPESSAGPSVEATRPALSLPTERIQSGIDASGPRHPEAVINKIIGFGTSDSAVIVQRSGPRLPGRWYRFDLEAEKEHLLFDEMPWIDPRELAETMSIHVPAADGKRIHAYLTLPLAERRSDKLIAIVHGGPRARDQWGWDREAQYFAALGYAVLKVNYTGSEGYGLAYSPLNHMDAIERSMRDVADCVRWANRNGLAEPGRAAIYGSSFGGHVALVSAALYPDLYACAIGYAGVYDWVKEFDREFKDEPVYHRLKQHTYYGDYDNEKDKWLAASAVSMIDEIDIPILLIHGRSDETVESSQSRSFHRALRKAKKDAMLRLLSFNRHGLVLEKQTIDFYRRLSDFTDKRLAK